MWLSTTYAHNLILTLILEPTHPQMLMQEDVVLRVSRLFRDDPELMKGFYQFLPDRSVQQRMAAKLDELEDMPGSDARYGRRKADGAAAPSSRGGGQTSGSVPPKRKRKALERDKERELAPKAGPSKV